MTEFQSLLKRMIVSAINAREVESQRVSRTLHDEVGQVLSAVGLHLDVLKLDFKDRVPEIVGRVREIQEYLEKAVHAALDRLVGRFRTQFDGSLRLLYDMNGRPPLPIGNAFYKIAELALDNAVQHARAKRIEVQVRSTRDALIMAVTDDGAGFSPEDADVHTPGLGILMMEHYAAQAAVELRLRSQPGRGTLVKASYRIKDSGPQGESEPHAL
jgi:signal transduction histidine kinase